MRPIQVENRALEIISRVEAGQPNEDVRVELKANWIEPQKAARQIAGHANAARGEPVLWLIGVDQDRGVVGADQLELSNWYAEVASEFDGMAPEMIDTNVPYHDRTVVALLFETDRAPFVIRNPDYGVKSGVSIAFEVPWREGTSTRTANRSDLIRLLVPLLNLPEVETLHGNLTLSQSTLSQSGMYCWHLRIQLYITPQAGIPVVIPFHRCEASATLPDRGAPINLGNVRLAPPDKLASGRDLQYEPDSYTIANTGSELIVQGPGLVNFSGEAYTDKQPTALEGSIAEIRARLLPTHANNSIVIAESLAWDPSRESQEIGRWKL
jgi:hypothetical protein